MSACVLARRTDLSGVSPAVLVCALLLCAGLGVAGGVSRSVTIGLPLAAAPEPIMRSIIDVSRSTCVPYVGGMPRWGTPQERPRIKKGSRHPTASTTVPSQSGRIWSQPSCSSRSNAMATCLGHQPTAPGSHRQIGTIDQTTTKYRRPGQPMPAKCRMNVDFMSTILRVARGDGRRDP